MTEEFTKDTMVHDKAAEAEDIAKKFPEEVRQAVEAMRRTVRARQVAQTPEPRLRYQQIE